MATKKARENQKYEEYWAFTLEYSDHLGEQFNTTLKIIIDYIDKFVDINVGMSSTQYNDLQNILGKVYSKSDSASTRKAINQFFRLGFINNSAKGYHYLAKTFLNETNENKKTLIYSKIMYENASSKRTFSNPTNVNELKFLVKTLEACGQISKDELLAVMFTNINDFPKGYMTSEELKFKYAHIIIDKVEERKYNQRNFLFNICSKLTGIYVKNNIMSINPELLLDKKEHTKVRDPYLQRLYKIELINEVKEVYGIETGKCVIEHLAYPVLIASHIKPYKDCNEEESFDRDNGLLLSKNVDSLFDLGYISFDETGKIMLSTKLDDELKEHLADYKLDAIIYNEQRQRYMNYHREHRFML